MSEDTTEANILSNMHVCSLLKFFLFETDNNISTGPTHISRNCYFWWDWNLIWWSNFANGGWRRCWCCWGGLERIAGIICNLASIFLVTTFYHSIGKASGPSRKNSRICWSGQSHHYKPNSKKISKKSCWKTISENDKITGKLSKIWKLLLCYQNIMWFFRMNLVQRHQLYPKCLKSMTSLKKFQ